MRRSPTRREFILAASGAFLLLLGTYWILQVALPAHDEMLEVPGCHVPITILNPPPSINRVGDAILVHGPSANRRQMIHLGDHFAAHGFRSYLFDLPGHGDNTDPFTFAAASWAIPWVAQLSSVWRTPNPWPRRLRYRPPR